MAYVWLALAILMEVFGSTMLKLSAGFKKYGPTIGFAIGFGVSFYLFSLALIKLPLGFSYAVWSGTGTVLTAFVGVLLFKEKINRQATVGLVLLVSGIILLNLVE